MKQKEFLRMARFCSGCLMVAGFIFWLPACRPAEPPTPTSRPIPPPAQTSLPETSPDAPGSTQTPAPQSAGLAGQVIGESDVAGQDSRPLAGQMVLALPADLAAELLGGGKAVPAEQLRFLRAWLVEAAPALVVTQSDAEGAYRLDLAPGDYIVCLADSESTPPAFPVITRGCGRVQVAAGAARQVDISSGFGEMVLVER